MSSIFWSVFPEEKGWEILKCNQLLEAQAVCASGQTKRDRNVILRLCCIITRSKSLSECIC